MEAPHARVCVCVRAWWWLVVVLLLAAVVVVACVCVCVRGFIAGGSLQGH